MSIDEIREQATSAIDDAYRAGFEAAIETLQQWRNEVGPDTADENSYGEGIDDAIITLEQAQ